MISPVVPMDAIKLFRAARVRRAANDAANKTREAALAMLTRPGAREPYYWDTTYGEEWRALGEKWIEAVARAGERRGISPYSGILVEQKGGRGANVDFMANFHDLETGRHHGLGLEFKFGGTTISELPEFFNPPASRPFHGAERSYGRFFWESGAAARAAAIYPEMAATTPPPLEEVEKYLYTNNYDAHPWFRALYEAEKRGTPEQKRQKKGIVDNSITEFLTAAAPYTNLELLSQEFRRSQQNKEFLIYNPITQTFHHDSLSEEELEAEGVVGVRNGNVLVIQSRAPQTTYHMLLRWKNHAGVLYPAWQISMRRAAAQNAAKNQPPVQP